MSQQQPPIKITPAIFPQDLPTVQSLFTAYTSTLPIDLSVQNYAAEFANLPGAYSAPDGTLLLARTPTSTLGCVCLRPLAIPGACEMKRLWVEPEGRGRGVGRLLVGEVLRWAREKAYVVVKLDTMGNMKEARRLYGGFGFRECEHYGARTVPGVIFMELVLRDGGEERGSGNDSGKREEVTK